MKRDSRIAFSWFIACVLIAAFAPVLLINDLYIEKWAAAWVQAVGSVIAILVAVFVPTKIEFDKQRSEKEERKRIESAAHFILIRELAEIIVYCYSRIIAIENDRASDVDKVLEDLNVPGIMTLNEKNKILRVDDERLSFFLSLNKEVMEKYNIVLISLKKTDVSFFNALKEEGNESLTQTSFREVKDEYNKIISLCNELRFMGKDS